MKRRLLIATPSLALAGCQGTLWPKAPQPALRYGLDPGTREPATPVPSSGPVLRIEPPQAVPELQGVQMLYRWGDGPLRAYAHAEWAAPPAALLLPLLQAQLQGAGLFTAVVSAPTQAPAVLRLESQLLALHQTFGAAPSRVRLQVRLLLLNTAQRRVLAQQTFTQQAPAPSEDAAGGAHAAAAAVRVLLAGLAPFCAQAMGRPA